MQNPIDYRITRNQNFLVGVVTSVLPGPGDYINVKLSDGRIMKYVKVESLGTVTLEANLRVTLENRSGRWIAKPF